MRLRLPWSDRHRPAVPAEVRARLRLDRGERVLAGASLAGGGHAVATDRALLLPTGDDWLRLPWHRVTQAHWDADAQVLEVEEAGSAPGHRLRLAEPSLLPETARERVTASILVSEHVRLVGRAGVRIVARRRHDSSEAAWQLVFDRGVDPGDPVIRAQAEHALEVLRAQTGV